MIAVALMSDPGNSFIKGKGKENPGPSWGKPRLGQCIVILELIAHLQKLTSEKKDPTAVSLFKLHITHVPVLILNFQPYENSKEPVVRFMGALEARLAIMMDARVRPCLNMRTVAHIDRSCSGSRQSIPIFSSYSSYLAPVRDAAFYTLP